MVLFAASMAAATFIGNDYGLPAAYDFIYSARWFELILLLLVINMAGQTISLKLYRSSKLPAFLFHLSFIVIIAGAAITRYTGWEGSIHIREGETENSCYSSDRHIGYSLKERDGALIASGSDIYSMTSVSAERYKKKISNGGKEYQIVLARIMQNALEMVVAAEGGEPMISLSISEENSGRELIILRKGEIATLSGLTIGFMPEEITDVTIEADSASFVLSSVYSVEETNMMTGETIRAEPGESLTLKSMMVVSVKNIMIVPQEMSLSAVTRVMPVRMSREQSGRNYFVFNISSGNESTTLYLRESGPGEISSATALTGDRIIEITYGPEMRTLPFSLKLNEFVLERYPGSESPSGYRSEITLIDEENNIARPYSIYMNNVLKYRGYRFYQSSYDLDEQGTILAVNNDTAGMLVTYTGYGLLFVFIIVSLFNRNSVFHRIGGEYWNSPLRKGAAMILFMLILSGFGSARAQKMIPDKEGSGEFGRVLVQDHKGRTKPLLTLSSDIMRKVTRENSFEGLTPMQFFMGIYLDFDNWRNYPVIRISNRDLQNMLGIKGDYASFNDMLDPAGGGTYKLSHEVNVAYSLAPGERRKFDKEVMKVDERMNIVYMIYSGAFLRIFPLRDGSHTWGAPMDALKSALNREDSLYVANIIPSLAGALETRNQAMVRNITRSLSDYQKRFTEYEIPSESKIKAEILYYRLKIFERLFPFYAATGTILLIMLIIMILIGRDAVPWLVRSFGLVLFAGFLLHTFGLGLRWYISGHSPMSNGYESMLFISWVTVLAGFIFSRRSPFTLPATGLLASFALLVAHMSFMDPEITNLVPVLKSYWLTLHVSVITGSYGFLGLGAVLALINMVLIILINSRNRERISGNIDNLTVICYKTLTLGLYFLTTGTFLGAIWANESWGRYWGWDPKETWSLITIVVYTLVVHSRMIPGMKDIFTFNLLALFAFFSVLMTYFGVNYYLSGLHSYAGGDVVHIPLMVYITVLMLVAVSIAANIRYRKEEKRA